MGPYDLANRLDAAGDLLAGSAPALDRLDPGPFASGGAGPGRLGELGRALHLGLSTGLANRGREAAAHAARFADTARGLRSVAAGYTDAERGVEDRHTGGRA